MTRRSGRNDNSGILKGGQSDRRTRGRKAPGWLLCLCVVCAVFSYGCALGTTTDASSFHVTTSSLPNGALQSAYSSGLSVSGGMAPYSWKMVGGTLPPGLSLSPSTGMVSGTPTVTGTFVFTVEAMDSSHNPKAALRGLSITVTSQPTPLSINTSSLPMGEISVGYSSAASATGGSAPYTWSIASGSLPAGLTLNSSNGTISGSPTASGPFSFSLNVRDSSATQQTATKALAITVETQVQVTTNGLPSATMKSAYSASLGAQGGTAPYTWRINSGSLPAGLSLSGTGSISGTPMQTGTTSFGVLVTDASGTPQTSTQSLSINVATSQGSPVTTLSVSTTGVVNGISTQQYSGAVSASGGTAPYTFSVTAGSLPAGLSLNSSTGAITGTPAVPGTFPFTVQVTDSGLTQQTAAGAASVLIVAPLQITTTSLPEMRAQASVNTTINIAGGMAPYVFSVSNGSLPSGLSLNSSTGALAGMPNASGSYRFTVQVNDPPALPQTASQTFSGSVTTGTSPLQVTSNSMPTGQVGTSYSSSLSATGGTQPYTWSVYSGTLNSGLTLSSSGQITGTPTAGGTDTFTVQVTDVNSLTATGSISIPVGASLTITTTSLPFGTQGAAFNSSLAATGGTTPYSWSVTSGSLPAGLTLASNGTISGSPSATGTFSFGVKVTDASSNTATQTLSIIVSSSVPGNPSPSATDSLTIYDVDGVSQNARPVTFGRVFAQGEITQCPQPTVDGGAASAWQADVKNRWPDGSAKFAVISLITPLNAAGSVTVGFQNSSTCNNSGYISTSSSPSFAGFNGGNWDAQIKVSAAGSTSVTTSAKSMLAASDPGGNTYGDCKNDYWLQGPVVTAVIVQDCTGSMIADFGWTWNGSTMSSPATGAASTASFHPMFILYFYPTINAVQAEEIIENDWNGKVQDQLADFSFSTEDSSGTLHTRWNRTGARVITGVSASVANNMLPAVSTATLTGNGANFTSGDVGMSVCVTNASYANPVCGTIRSVSNSTTAVMALPTLDGMWGGGSGLTAYMDLVSAATRHRKTFWSGTAPGHIRIDYNFSYLISTRALPSYDLANASINPHNGYYPSGKCCDYGYDGWVGTDRGEIGGFSGITGGYAAVLEGAPLQRADLALLYNMGSCGVSNGYCAVAMQQLTGLSALGDSSTHAGLDSSTVTQYDVSGGGGMWDVFGGIPFHFRESRTTATSNGFNGIGTGNTFPCYYVSQFENKNATYNTTLNPSSFSQCLGGGDNNVADPTGPNNSVGRAPSLHAHSDLGAGEGTLGVSPAGSVLNPPYGWDVVEEGPFHWLDYTYLPYLLTGSPYYLENEYQSAAFQPNFSSGYNGIYSLYNGHYILRWLPWGMQSASRAAFIAPDGSADQAYWNSVVNSNIEFVEGALGVTGTALTPASSQGNFATSGTISNFNVIAANRWDLGRYNEITGTACATTGSGSCVVLPSGLHQWSQGFCDSSYPTFNHSSASAASQYWMYWYNNVVFGEVRDMGFNQAAAIQNQMGQFLEGMVLSPTNNPWYGVASYETPVTSGPSSGCTAGIGQNLPFYTRYGGPTGIYGGWNSSYGNPTTTTSQGNFSFSAPSGGITTGNFPCADHGYSLLARAAGTFLPSYGVNETDADGTYTPTNAWSWLNTNVPFFGNAAFQALPSDCLAGSDTQIKWALTPRQ